MAKHLSVRQAVRLALFTSAIPVALVAPAFAQEQDASDSIDEVVVTGSRIVSPNLQSISPITAIGAEELNIAGKSRIEDVLNQLPQAFAAQGSNISNGSDGTATVDLRGLGARRTLVLVNGRRLMPGDPSGGSAADLNQIPLSLVKRVDVLTGGASSVYGADAVAGVVNFVMDTEFEGVRIDSNYSFYNHKNRDDHAQDIVSARGYALPDSSVNTGYSKDFSIAVGIGGAEGRGHATFYASYRDVDPVSQASYDYSACTLGLGTGGVPGTGAVATDSTCGGSSTSFPGRFLVIDPRPDDPNDPDDTGGQIVGSRTLGPGNVLRAYSGARDAYNFGPLNYFQRPDERYTAGVFGNFKLSEKADVYGEVMFMDDRSVAQIAPSGAFIGPTYSLNCNNPLWSASMKQEFCTDFGLTDSDFAQVIIGRRDVEGGPRRDDIGHSSYRIVMGVRGELNDMLSYDGYIMHGETKRNSTYFNDFSIRRTNLALNAATDTVPGSPTLGQVVCSVNTDYLADGVTPNLSNNDANCRPWNIWQAGGVNATDLAYVLTPGFQRATARTEIAHFDMTADLTSMVKLPSTETGLVFNMGAEYRDEKTNFTVDQAFQTGDLAGQGGATLPVFGRFDVSELFLEGRLPLVEGKTGAKSLSVEAGYRYSDYSTGFTTDTYKAGFDWAPIDMLRFRASYQHAVRAPNVAELYSTRTVGLDGGTDPCAGEAADLTYTAAQCALTGVTAAQYGNILASPAGQYNGLLGGTATLTPEKSDTFSYGLVFRPDVGDLSIAIDYFDIKIENTISSVTGGNADAYLKDCLETGLASFCDRIHRDSFGSLWISPTAAYVDDVSSNVGTLQTHGVDLQASYTLNLGEHRLGFNLVGTKLFELANAPVAGFGTYDCTGFYGNTCTNPSPSWRHSFRANWRTPWNGLDVAATWRYFGDSKSERLSGNTQLAADVNANGLAQSIPAYSYVDLTASMTFAEKFTVRVGANNLFDKSPPYVPSGDLTDCPSGPCNGNTWAQMYDSLGRQVFASVTVDF